jgi:hypothetical protein
LKPIGVITLKPYILTATDRQTRGSDKRKTILGECVQIVKNRFCTPIVKGLLEHSGPYTALSEDCLMANPIELAID